MSIIDNRGWFSTLEFPRVTALLVQQEKDKKYVTSLKELANGNCIVLYRGRNDTEKEEIKERKKEERLNAAREKAKVFSRRSS